MKKLILVLLFALFGIRAGAQNGEPPKAGDLPWYTDLLKANEASKASGKPIFAFFTGSDWCTWCHKLEKDVMQKQAFIDWSKNVILLELDFPRRKQLSPELMQQNMSLQQTFQVVGYPTIWMFRMAKDEKTNNYTITPLGTLGYPQGAEPGKEEVKFLEDANILLGKEKAK